MSGRGRDAIAQVPLFANLSPRYVRRLGDLMEESTYAQGATIVRTGDAGETFYVILEGEAKVSSPTGRTLNRVYPGEFFGEISLMDGGTRTATVTAETPLRTLELTRKDFTKLLELEPRVAVALLQHGAKMLRRLERSASS